MKNPTISAGAETAISHRAGFRTRPDMIPPQKGITIRRKGISLLSTVSSYETIPNKDRKNIDLHESIHHGFYY
jgi:hypothetical protein